MGKEKSQAVFTVRVDKSIADVIARACEQGGVSKSEFVRAALKVGLSRASVITILNRAIRDRRD